MTDHDDSLDALRMAFIGGTITIEEYREHIMGDDTLTDHEKQLALKAEHAKRRAASRPGIQECWPSMDEADSPFERFAAYLSETFDTTSLQIDIERERRAALLFTPDAITYTYHVEATFRSTGYARQFLDTVKAVGYNGGEIAVNHTGYGTFPDGRGQVTFSFEARPDADPFEAALDAFRAAESPKPAFGGITNGDHDVLDERYEEGEDDGEGDEEAEVTCPECGSTNVTAFSTGDYVCENNHNFE